MSLDINKQKMTYALPTGQKPKYELDSDGNIAYEGYMGEDGLFVPYLDDDGNKIPKGSEVKIIRNESIIMYVSEFKNV